MNLVKQKGKLLLVLILAFVATITLGMLSLGGGATTAHAMSGSGTASDPYLISTKADLEAFRDKVNAGQTTINGKLMADINLANSAWTPISGGNGSYYSGTFDGNGYTVSGLNVAEDANVGFFGILYGGTVKNLTVKGTVQGRKRAGGIVGFIGRNSTVYNCTNECSVSTSSTTTTSTTTTKGGIAGIAGYVPEGASAIINACTNKGNITASGTSVSAGGIVGYVENSSVTVKNSVNFGSITAKEDAGGIIGYVYSSGSSATVIGCFNKGTIKNEGDTKIYYGAGGILGRLGTNGSFTAKYCGNDGSVSALAKSMAPAGGILAISNSTKTINLSNCYNTAVITGAGSTGGLLGSGGSCTVSITNSFNSGKVIATGDGLGLVGGIAGGMKGSMNYVFNYGNVVNQSGADYFSRGEYYHARGSILGDGATNVSNAYYLDGTCKLGIGYNGNTDEHTGSATSIDANQMRTQSSFSGWDFDKVWVMEANYPVLRHAHDFAYEADGDTIIATCERPYCDVDGGAIYSLTIKAPTLKNERGEGSEFASFDENELSVFNEAAGLSLNIDNITYAKVEDGNVTDLDAAPTTAGDYVAKLTIGGAVASVSYSIGKIEVNFDKDILLNGESSTSTVSNLNEQTAATLLTDEEIERYVNGESVNIYLVVNNESGAVSIPVADKTAAKAAIETSGAKEGAYLDLKLFKQLSNDAERTAISESATAFDITLDIPSDITTVPYGYTRTYSIIRVHNGVAETLDCSVSGGKISFSTDKFSTYLIAYSDEFDENGEYIEFTSSIVGENIRYSNDIVANESTVVVNYKITHNDGFNSILLIPQFDTNVFAIASDNSGYLISVNEVALGAAEITPVGDGTIKIVLDNTGDPYTATFDDDNTIFLTVTYKFISATAGEYNFGLVLSSNEENGKSEAFYITDANEQKGDQNRVAIRVISNVLTVYERAYIVIGQNNDDPISYQFTFEYTEVTVEKVAELGETENLIAQYTYNGTATPVITWYDKDMNLMDYEGPIHVGTYYLGISAPQHGIYGPVEEVLRKVVIVPKPITITADNHGHTYGNTPVTLTPETAGIDNEIQVTFTVKDGDDVIELSALTNVDTYTIVPFASHPNYVINCVPGTYTVTAREITITAEDKGHVYGDQPAALAPTTAGLNNEIEVMFTVKDGDDVIVLSSATNVGNYTIIPFAADPNYTISFVNGTYTVTKKALTITALNQTAEYNGEEPEVIQTKYKVTIDNTDYDYNDDEVAGIVGVVINKVSGVDVGDYVLYIVYENGNYDINTVEGKFTIVSAGADVVAIRAFFDKINRVYNGANQDLLVVDGSEFETYFVTGYTANGNINKIVGSYDITVTVTVDNNHNVGDNDLKDLVFVIEGAKITPAQVSVSANNVNVYYGEDPVVPVVPDDFTIVGTVYGNDNLNIAYVIKNGNQAFTPTNSTAVGSYDIVVSASNSNYDIELNDGVYKVLKATADMINITVSAEDVYYNRALDYDINVTVNGNITLTADDYTVSFLGVYGTPVNAGSYTIVVTVTDTDNYAEKEGTDTFVIKQVKLEGVTFTYSHGNVSWTAVANDIGKTADEEGVLAKALKDGTTITYKVYNGETLVGTYNERTFDALAAATYKVVAVASDDNYIASESVMAPAYEVTFDEGDHTANPDGEVSNLPATQYIFAGETVVAPASNPAVVGCTFSLWKVENATYTFTEAVNGDITIVAIWDEIIYTITFKYLPASETVGTDVFTLTRTYGETVDYSSLSMVPVKSSDNAGIYYTFANKWTDTESTEYTASNDIIQGFTVTGDMTFVAVFDTNYNSYKITYYFFDNDTNEYVEYGEEQVVTYNNVIEYRTFTGDDYAWFVKDYWYGNTARTSAVPVKMPAENISVYGAYKFNIGQGDVNADGNVTADDITLYRQWIVGGYEMTVIASGNEWATVTDANFDATARYYLKRVSDNNADDSRDIRDVSITRMAIVGGYDWDISTGTTVTGQNIDRTKTATAIEHVVNGLAEYGRARMYMNVTDTTADIEFNVDGNLYLDLGGKNLTVKSFVLNTNSKNATITVKNGTLTTINGITITAPNGNVILEDLIGYVGETQVNLQAAQSSLHFAGEVAFYKQIGSTATENVAPIHVEEGTHIVIEQEAVITVEKIVVTENFVATATAGVTLDNQTVNEVIIEGVIENTINTLAELVDAKNCGGDYILGADIYFNGTLVFARDISINLNGHTIRSLNSNTMFVTNGATLIVSGNGNVIAQEACVVAYDASTVVINNGTYTAIDNFVIGTNGSTGRGNNNITINAGTFNGGITSNGYIACGIYVANNDTVNVKAGTFNITNGCGILARSGNTTVGANVVFNVTGNGTTGKVGDSKVLVPSGEALVLDLAANYPGGDPAIVNNGAYDICAVVETLADINAVKASVSGIVLSQDITTNYAAPIYFTKDMTLNLNGKTITSTNDVALRAMNGATLTIDNGNVVAQEACVMAFNGSTVVINGGTYTAIDNFVIGTNGSNGQGGNTITINGGTFNGGITSNGYIACGVYVANSDTVVINGGTFNITDGVGILARSGNTTVNDGVTFNMLGANTRIGGVGDKQRNFASGDVIVIDYSLATYPGGVPTLINNTDYDAWGVIDADTKVKAVSTKAALAAAIGNVVLSADINAGANDITYTEDVTINLNGHSIIFSSWGFDVRSGATLTFNGTGSVTAVEAALYAQYAGKLVVNGGTFTSTENFVIGTHGSTGRGNNEITINGGTFNGSMAAKAVAKGYIACGIYVANSDTVVINGGTFNIINGCGILARSGNTTVSENVTFNVSGNGTLGKIGDSSITVPTGAVLVVDFAANYPGVAPVLTNNTSYEVYYLVANEAQLRTALEKGGNIKLMADITVTGTTVADRLTITVDTNLDLNGHTIKSADGLEPSNNWSTLWVKNGAVANIMNGTIGSCYDTDGISDAPYGITVGENNGTAGTVNLTNVNVNGGITAVQVILGEVNIYSGNYKASPYQDAYEYLLNCIDANYKKGTAGINVYGGTFESFNPADCAAEGENTNFVAVGYQVTENDGIYTVSAN